MPKSILIAASGTGGHLFPARYIVEELQSIDKDLQIHFLGAGRPLEDVVFGDATVQRHVIAASGIAGLGVLGVVKFLLKAPIVLFKVWRLLSKTKPAVVVGVGGYVSIFPVVLARLRQIPTWIHEAECEPGLATRFLKHFATKISTAAPSVGGLPPAKVVFSGHPVRKGLAKVGGSPWEGSSPRNILVLGGSQGARALDKVMIDCGEFIKKRGLSVYHQCREEDRDELLAHYQTLGIDSRVVTFIDDVEGAFEWADVVVSRAGAGAVVEIGVSNRPAILVPYPYAQGNHQQANAMLLAAQGKAFLVDEGPEFTERLQSELDLLLDPGRYREMRERESVNIKANAAETIATGCLQLAANFD